MRYEWVTLSMQEALREPDEWAAALAEQAQDRLDDAAARGAAHDAANRRADGIAHEAGQEASR